jgi:hypothetical protein
LPNQAELVLLPFIDIDFFLFNMRVVWWARRLWRRGNGRSCRNPPPLLIFLLLTSPTPEPGEGTAVSIGYR